MEQFTKNVVSNSILINANSHAVISIINLVTKNWNDHECSFHRDWPATIDSNTVIGCDWCIVLIRDSVVVCHVKIEYL